MADRYSDDRFFFGPEDQYQEAGVPRSRTPRTSSARDYAAAGVDLDRGNGYRGQRFDRERNYGYADADYGQDYRGSRRRYRGDDYSTREREPNERGFLERAGDELRSWFGDTEAERRRERDMRGYDQEYGAWRRERIDELDRDYDEYRRENAQRFHNEFTSWRTERQGQRDGLRRVIEHMEVVGSDGSHVGKVDKVRGDRIILAKNDTDSGGHHHSIPSRWIDSVGEQVVLRKTAEEAKAAWRDEERSGAFFGEDREDSHEWRGDHNLNRSFKGTY